MRNTTTRTRRNIILAISISVLTVLGVAALSVLTGVFTLSQLPIMISFALPITCLALFIIANVITNKRLR